MPLSKNNRKMLWGSAIVVVLVFVASLFVAFLMPFTGGDERYVCIDRDDNIDSVCTKLQDVGASGTWLFRIMAGAGGYAGKVQAGRYQVGEGQSMFGVFRRLRGRIQAPVKFVVPMVNTTEHLAARLGKLLLTDSAEWAAAFRDSALLAEYDADTATLPALFIPNTFEIYWTIEPKTLLGKMKKNADAYWTAERRAKAQKADLTPVEVVTLASIVEKETAKTKEKPRIAGMYLNRLHKDMNLSADPTVKFALRNFGLRRILYEHLKVESPYNTYKHKGLPPGPICIPSIESIEAVLDFENNDYLFMCAKEDFSGYHNFAASAAEHMANARRYSQAQDARNIK